MAGYSLGESAKYEKDPSFFSHRVKVFQPTYADDGMGGKRTVIPDTPTMTLYARVENFTVTERRVMDQNTTDRMVLVYIRYRTGVADDWLLEWRGVKYSVKGWNDVENRNRLLCITAVALPNVR